MAKAMKMRRILHPSDFSSASRAAFARAVAMARADGAELLLVHVMTPVIPPMDGYISPKLYDDMQRSMEAHARKQLDKLVAKAKASRIRVRGVLLEGTPADRIVRAARSHHADVIVIGTHGRTGLARVFLGSVAERVVGTAPCPVLTVRGK
jgi:nucleotide-binding universal stress UspA family protein